MSWLAGTLNLLNTIIGAGLLSLPFAFKSCGLLAGAAYQLVFGAMTLHAIRLLLSCLHIAGAARSYEELAQLALGRHGWLSYNLLAFANGYGSCLGCALASGSKRARHVHRTRPIGS